MKFVDCHVHISISSRQPWEHLVDKLLADMEVFGIEQAVIMPHPLLHNTYASRDEIEYQAEALGRITNANPGKFYPLLFINPILSPTFILDLMDKHMLNGPIVGAKFHVQMLADDKRLQPIYQFLESNDIPLLFHSWYKTTDRVHFESDPRHIVRLAEQHPKLRILMAHLTGCKIRGVQDIKNYPNIYLDTSGSQPEEGYLQRALEELGGDRILYGSDYPIRSFATQIARIDSVEMDMETRGKVFRSNALRFFGKEGAN